MNFPVMVIEEIEENGISGSVYCFHGFTTRLFPANILLYVLQGSGTCTYRLQEATLTKGDFLFICENESFQLQAEECYGLLISIPSVLLFGCQQNIHCCSAVFPDKAPFLALSSLLQMIVHTQYRAQAFYKVRLQALWKQLIYELLRHFCSPGSSFTEKKADDPVQFRKMRQKNDIAEILDLLERDYSSNLNLKDIAALYYYSPSYLSKLFIRYTGMHFSEYLTELRLKKAMPLLIQTNLDISMISDRTGFPNPRAFQQAFQKKYHLRPSRYRSDYAQTAAIQSQEQIHQTLCQLMNSGILADIQEPLTPFSNDHTADSVYLNYGVFSFYQTTPVSIRKKNNILNVTRARDLLIDSIQEKVRILQQEIGFEYLNCHGFLANDLQIYYQSDFPFAPSQALRSTKYDFSLLEKIVSFAREVNLKFIFHLSYMPSFLAEKLEPIPFHHGDNIAMPRSMEEWNSYIFQLFSFLYERFGNWLLSCPVLLWETPDIHINFHTLSLKDYLQLYKNTYTTIKNILPGIPISSPTISCSQPGLFFVKAFLTYCKQNDCLPDMISCTYIENDDSHASFHVTPSKYRNFSAETQNILHSLKLEQSIPIHLLEYFYTLGIDPICDSMVGAMLPLRITLESHTAMDNLGFWAASDFTTHSAYGPSRFCGTHGIFSQMDDKKPVFYTLQFLSWLGDDCLTMRNGCIITRKGAAVQMLLYYDIPKPEWGRRFSEEYPLEFYRQFPDRQISFDITQFFFPDTDKTDEAPILLKEYYLNFEKGSGYETWLKSGGRLLDSGRQLSSSFSASPVIETHVQKIKHGVFHYEKRLKPFEIRFVEILPFHNER